MNDKLYSQLVKYANQDLNLAQRQGDLMIADTKQGRVMVQFDSPNTWTVFGQERKDKPGDYSHHLDGAYSVQLAKGNKAAIRNFLIDSVYIYEG